MRTKTKTKNITGTKLAIATLITLATGGIAFAAVPNIQLSPRTFSPQGNAPTVISSTTSLVKSCVKQNNGITVVLLDDTEMSYQNNCEAINPNGGNNFLEYNCNKGNTGMITTRYEFCCHDSDNGNIPAIRGVISLPHQATAATDNCQADKTKLDEYICDASGAATRVEVPVNAGQECLLGRIRAIPTPPVSMRVSNLALASNRCVNGTNQLLKLRILALSPANHDVILKTIRVQFLHTSSMGDAFQLPITTSFEEGANLIEIDTRTITMPENGSSSIIEIPINRIMSNNQSLTLEVVGILRNVRINTSMTTRLITYTFSDANTNQSFTASQNVPLPPVTCAY